MINSLSIENFQSHEKTSIDFSNGLNIIIGQTNSGKSAILKALHWLVFNRPSGNEFIQNEKEFSHVICSFDKNVIERFKSENENYYKINGSMFKSFGRDIPEEIEEAMKMDDINFQSQLSPIFLLSESSGEVARKLNNIAELELIDISISNLNSQRREIKERIKFNKEKKEELEKQIETYKWVENADKEQKAIEKRRKKYEKLTEKYEMLRHSFLQYKQKYEEYENYNYDECVEIFWNECNEKNIQLKEKKSIYINLSSDVERMKVVANSLKECIVEIKELERRFDELFPEVCPLCGR
jgi:chromosome segregation ATPase